MERSYDRFWPCSLDDGFPIVQVLTDILAYKRILQEYLK